MSLPEPTATAKGEGSELLSAQVDSAAVQIVLGALDRSEQLSLLRSIAGTAGSAGRCDVAGMISDAVSSASAATEAAIAAALISDCIKQVQQALSNPLIEPAHDGSPSAPAKGGSVSLSEDRELLGDFI